MLNGRDARIAEGEGSERKDQPRHHRRQDADHRRRHQNCQHNAPIGARHPPARVPDPINQHGDPDEQQQPGGNKGRHGGNDLVGKEKAKHHGQAKPEPHILRLGTQLAGHGGGARGDVARNAAHQPDDYIGPAGGAQLAVDIHLCLGGQLRAARIEQHAHQIDDHHDRQGRPYDQNLPPVDQ